MHGVLSHDAIIIALITVGAALVSALLSAVVAIYISRSSTRREIRKAQIGSLIDKIIDKRISEYPELYSIISNMIKEIKDEPLLSSRVGFAKSDALHCMRKINDWDNRNSLFLGRDAIAAIIWFKHTVYGIVHRYQDDAALISSVDDLNLIIRAIENLELALKGEIGIFPLEDGLEKAERPEYGVIDGRRHF